MITMTKDEVRDLVLEALKHHGIDIPENDQPLGGKVDSLDLFQAYLYFEEQLRTSISESQIDPFIANKPFSEMIDKLAETINKSTDIKII